jgi:predicted  nucleic acid-binding Zn-ribbon protein
MAKAENSFVERIKALECEAIEAEERFRSLNADFVETRKQVWDLLDKVDDQKKALWKLEDDVNGLNKSASPFPSVERLRLKRMDELTVRDKFVHNKLDYTLHNYYPVGDDKMAYVCFCLNTEFFEVFYHKDMLVFPK